MRTNLLTIPRKTRGKQRSPCKQESVNILYTAARLRRGLLPPPGPLCPLPPLPPPSAAQRTFSLPTCPPSPQVGHKRLGKIRATGVSKVVERRRLKLSADRVRGRVVSRSEPTAGGPLDHRPASTCWRRTGCDGE